MTNKINSQVSGEKGFWIFKHQYTKSEKVTAQNFIGMQRSVLQGDDEVIFQGNSTVEKDGKTYQFTDQQSVVDTLFEYADKDGNGVLDEDEYNRLLAENVTDGVIGDEKDVPTINQGLNLGTGQMGLYLQNGKMLTPDYAELIKAADTFLQLKSADADAQIDANKDGYYSKDEFSNSIITKIISGDAVLNLQDDSMSYDQRLRMMSMVSDGMIAQRAMLPSVNYNFSIPEGQFNYNTSTKAVLSPDFDGFINVATQYGQLKNK